MKDFFINETVNKCISLDEVAVMPSKKSRVKSRKDVNPFDENGKLPIFVSPMTCLLDKDNFRLFEESKVIPIYPIWYKETLESRMNMCVLENVWVSVTVDEFKKRFADENGIRYGGKYKVLIDCADGHMEQLYEMVKRSKELYKDDLTVMIGNIGNPEAYIECCKAGVDYVRVGIGGNINCETGSKTGINISLPFMLEEIKKIKSCLEYDSLTNEVSVKANNNNGNFWELSMAVIEPTFCVTKVIADGGVNRIDKIMKCLCLGADYVMCGTLFSKTYEACGELDRTFHVDRQSRKYYGQASKQGIIDRKGEDFFMKNQYTEGSEAWLPIEYSLDEFTTEVENVLRTVMSYQDSFNLNEMIGHAKWCEQTISQYKSFNKK